MPLRIDLIFQQAPTGRLVIVYGVQTDAPQALPTVWQIKDNLAQHTSLTIPWNDQLEAYYSDAKCVAGDVVNNESTAVCGLGETFRLDQNQAISVDTDGPHDQLSIFNDHFSEWTFGCSLDTGDGFVPNFACTLGAGDLIQAIPGPNLLLYFVTGTASVRQIIGPSPYALHKQAALPYSEIACLNLAQLAGSRQLEMPSLQYDSSRGWVLPQPMPVWATIHEATSDIPSLAILPLPDQPE